jgi:glutathione peroxidase-family protein
LAFPSKEFGSQEYSTDEEIQAFAESKNFPGVLMKLGKVKGDGAQEVWKFMKQESGAKDPNWNFRGKFLVSKSGVVSAPQGDVEEAIAALMEE